MCERSKGRGSELEWGVYGGGGGNSYKLTCFKHFQYFMYFSLAFITRLCFNEFLL